MVNIYLPSATVTLLRRPGRASRGALHLRTPRHFTKVDIRNYLRSVYAVETRRVNTAVEARRWKPHPSPGKLHRHPNSQAHVWTSMYKRAYVQIRGTFDQPPPSEAELQVRKKKISSKKFQIERKLKERKLFVDKWDKIVRERYGSVQPLADPPAEPLPEGLQNLQLDEDAVVKRNVERRTNPASIKKPRKWIVVHRLRDAKRQRALERKTLKEKERQAVGDLLQKFRAKPEAEITKEKLKAAKRRQEEKAKKPSMDAKKQAEKAKKLSKEKATIQKNQ